MGWVCEKLSHMMCDNFAWHSSTAVRLRSRSFVV